MKFCRKSLADVGIFLCVLFFSISAIYPSRRFIVEYAFFFKASYFFLMIFACIKIFSINSLRVNKDLNLGLCLWLLGLILSACFSKFNIRCGSEIDIPLAAMSFAVIYCFYSKNSFDSFLRIFGVTLVLFAYFSICLCLACVRVNAINDYPWIPFLLDNLFNPFGIIVMFFNEKIRINTPFDYINYAGLFGTIILPFFVGLFAWEKIKKFKIVWVLGIFLSCTIIFSTKCRGAILSTCIVFFIAIVIWAINKIKNQKFAHKMLTIAILVISIIGICAATNSRFKNLWYNIASGDISRVTGERFHLAKDGLKLFLEKPIVGHGITASPLMYMKAKPKIVHHCWQLHVAPVQDLLEFGLIGFLGLFIIGFYGLFIAIKMLLSQKINNNEKKLIFGTAMSLLAYITFVSEFSWDLFVVSATICTIFGLLLTYYVNNFNEKRQSTIFVKILMHLAVFVCAYFSIKDLYGRHYFRKFLNISKYNLCESKSSLNKAIENDPSNLYYYNQAGNVFALSGYPYSINNVITAIEYLEKSLKICPWQPHVLENIGTFYSFLGNYRKGINCYISSIKLLPYNSLAYIQLIECFHKIGNHFMANKLSALAAFLNPNLFYQYAFIDFFVDNDQAKKDLFTYYQKAEELDNSLSFNDAWLFEKESRAYLLGLTKTVKMNKAVKDYTSLYNFFFSNNLDNIYYMCYEAKKMNKYRHEMNDSTHSNRKILLHGVEGPSLFTFTLKQMSAPINMPQEKYPLPTSSALNKPADLFIDELFKWSNHF